jgi:hypothetical protein
MRELPTDQTKPVHRFAWLWEPLERDATFVLRSMFGSRAIYLDGKMVSCVSANEEPWRGILICTDRDHHPSLIESFPALTPHPHLSKWLYLPESNDAFETIAKKIVRLVRNRDPRIGVVPSPKKRRKSAKPKL